MFPLRESAPSQEKSRARLVGPPPLGKKGTYDFTTVSTSVC